MTLGQLQRELTHRGAAEMNARLQGGEWAVNVKWQGGGWTMGKAGTLDDAARAALRLPALPAGGLFS